MRIFKFLIGKTITEIEQPTEELIFTFSDGEKIRFYHVQECCETVEINDIIGDLNDLKGSPLVEAEEVTSKNNPPGVVKEWQDSFTWTFYRFGTKKGFVTVRWYGESNGYYSESVDFEVFKSGKWINHYDFVGEIKENA